MAVSTKYTRAVETGDLRPLLSPALPSLPSSTSVSASGTNPYGIDVFGINPYNIRLNAVASNDNQKYAGSELVSKHTVDTNNPFTYRSFADVLINYEAQQRRWNGTYFDPDYSSMYGAAAELFLPKDSWAYDALHGLHKAQSPFVLDMTNPLNTVWKVATQLPRVVTDSALLVWDQNLLPFVNAISYITDAFKTRTEDNFLSEFRNDAAFTADVVSSATTASIMNGLTNLGNTLDYVANVVKGTVLETAVPWFGGTVSEDLKDKPWYERAAKGFWRGYVGDPEQGRKQYDYIDYIDTGDYFLSGAVDFLISLGLEVVSDPTNLFLLGSKSLVSTASKQGSKIASDVVSEAVESGLKTVTKETAEEVIENTAKTATKEIAEEVAEETAEGVTKATAKEVIEEAAEETAKTATKQWVLDDGTDAIKHFSKKYNISEDSVKRIFEFITTDDVLDDTKVKQFKRLANRLTQNRFYNKLINESKELTPDIIKNSLDDLTRKGRLDKFIYGKNHQYVPAVAELLQKQLPQTAEALPKLVRFAHGADQLDALITKGILLTNPTTAPIGWGYKGIKKAITASRFKAGLKAAAEFIDQKPIVNITDGNVDIDVIKITDDAGNVVKTIEPIETKKLNKILYKLYSNNSKAFYDALSNQNYVEAQNIVKQFKKALSKKVLKHTSLNLNEFIKITKGPSALRDINFNLKIYDSFAKTVVDQAYVKGFIDTTAARIKSFVEAARTQSENLEKYARLIQLETGTDFIDNTTYQELFKRFYKNFNNIAFNDIAMLPEDLLYRDAEEIFNSEGMSELLEDITLRAGTFYDIQNRITNVVPFEEFYNTQKNVESFKDLLNTFYGIKAIPIDKNTVNTKDLLLGILDSYSEWYDDVARFNETLSNSIIKSSDEALIDYADEFDNYFKSLPTVDTRIQPLEDLNTYAKTNTIDYALMASRKHVLQSIIHQEHLEILCDSYESQDVIYKLLNDEVYKNQAETIEAKKVIKKLIAYKTLEKTLRNNLNTLLVDEFKFSNDNAKLFIDRFTDSLLVHLERHNSFSPAMFAKTFNEVMDKTNMGVNAILKQRISKMDYFVEVYGKVSDDLHDAGADVKNWFNVMNNKESPFYDHYILKTKDKYKIGLDLEATSADLNNAEVYQIAVTMYNAADKIVAEKVYNIALSKRRVDNTFLNKLGMSHDEWYAKYQTNTVSLQDALDDINSNFILKAHQFSGKNPVLCGHNILGFDLPLLEKRANFAYTNTFKDLLDHKAVFDSFVNTSDTLFRIQDGEILKIKNLLEQLVTDSTYDALTKHVGYERIFTRSDLNKLSEFKSLLPDYIEGYAGVKGYFENAIDGILNVLKENKTSSLGTVIRVTPDTLTKEGINIMSLINGGVIEQDGLILNIKRIRDNNFINYFDTNKIIKDYANIYTEGYVPRAVLTELFKRTKAISGQRTRITSKLADVLYDDAAALFRYMSNDLDRYPLFRYISEDVLQDKVNTVAVVSSYSPQLNKWLTEITDVPTHEATNGFIFKQAHSHSLMKRASSKTNFKTIANDTAVKELKPRAENIIHLNEAYKTLNDFNKSNIPFKEYIATKRNEQIMRWDLRYEVNNALDILKHTDEDATQILLNKNVSENIVDAYKYNKRIALKPITDLSDDFSKYCTIASSDDLKYIFDTHNKLLTKQAETLYLEPETFIKHAPFIGGRIVVEVKAWDEALLSKLSTFVDDPRFVVSNTVVETTPGVRKKLAIVSLTQDEYVKALDDIDPEVVAFYESGAKLIQTQDAPETAINLLRKTREIFSGTMANTGYSLGGVYTEALGRRVDNLFNGINNTKAVNTDFLISQSYFNKLNANNIIIGSGDIQYYFNTEYTRNPIVYLQNTFTRDVLPQYDNQALFINTLISDYTNISKQDVYKVLSDEQLFELYQRNKDDIKFVTLKKSDSKFGQTATGVQVIALEPQSAKDIKLMREANVHIVPTEFYQSAVKSLNKFKLPYWAQFLQQVSVMYRLGYISSPGTIIRNAIDSFKKNTYTEGIDTIIPLGDDVSRLFKTVQLLNKYKVLTEQSGNVIRSIEEYKIMYKYLTEGKSSFVYTLNNKTYSIDDLLNLQGPNSAALDNLITKARKDAEIINAVSNVKNIDNLKKNLIEPGLFELTDTYMKSNASAGLSTKMSEYFYEIKDPVKKANKAAADKAIDPVSLLKRTNKALSDKLPGTKHLFNLQELVEQSARFNLFLSSIRHGDGYNTAIRKVIETHFDYSDKSLAMIYAEMVFPFLSFSFKNLIYYIEQFTKTPGLVRIFSDYLKCATDYNSLWNPDYEVYNNFDYSISSYEFDKVNRPWQFINQARVYQILQGNIIIDTGKDVEHDYGYDKRMSDLYVVFKLNPSFMDAYNFLTNPLESVERRLLPPYRILKDVVTDTLTNGLNFKDTLKQQSWLTLVPFIGAVSQRIGLTEDGFTSHNNIKTRIEDVDMTQLLTSMFTAVYVPHKKYNTWYGRDKEYLTKLPQKQYYTGGGFKTNYYARRVYGNPYYSKYPMYSLYKSARNTKAKSIYANSKRANIYNDYSNLFRNQLTDDQLKRRVIDKYYYY